MVAIAAVPRTDSKFVNWLLRLPTEALAIMAAEITFGGQKLSHSAEERF